MQNTINNAKTANILKASQKSLENPLLSQMSTSTFRMSSQFLAKPNGGKKKSNNFILQNIKSVKHWSRSSGQKNTTNNTQFDTMNVPAPAKFNKSKYLNSKYSEIHNSRNRKSTSRSIEKDPCFTQRSSIDSGIQVKTYDPRVIDVRGIAFDITKPSK